MVSFGVNDLYRHDSISRKANRVIRLLMVILPVAIYEYCALNELRGTDLLDLHNVIITYMIYTPHCRPVKWHVFIMTYNQLSPFGLREFNLPL
jgi:hypothetical protein